MSEAKRARCAPRARDPGRARGTAAGTLASRPAESPLRPTPRCAWRSERRRSSWAAGSSSARTRRKRARAIVAATTYWQDAKKLAEISTGLGQAMLGVAARTLTEDQQFAARGW